MGINYERSGDVIEITIRDVTKSKIGTWKFNAADIELGSSIINHIKKKYGFSPEIKPSDNIKSKDKKESNFLDMSCDW